MKKEYLKPEYEAVEVVTDSAILALSNLDYGGSSDDYYDEDYPDPGEGHYVWAD